MVETVKRKISRSKYVAAAAITILIFSFGLVLGFVIENSRVSYITDQLRSEQTEFSSLQTQYTYLSQLGAEGDCTNIGLTFDDSIRNLDDSRLRLEQFEQDANIDKAEFELLRRDYMLAQIRFWLLAKQEKQACNSNTTSILYFYSTKEQCPSCENQAFILTYLKKKYGDNILIFSFDGLYEKESMIKILKDTYGITQYPSVVVGNTTFSGFVSRDVLLQAICEASNASLSDCSTVK